MKYLLLGLELKGYIHDSDGLDNQHLKTIVTTSELEGLDALSDNDHLDYIIGKMASKLVEAAKHNAWNLNN